MKFEETLKASESWMGALAPAAFVTLKALEAAGASATQIAELESLIISHLPRVEDEDRAILIEVLAERLGDALAHDAYDGTVKLAGRLSSVEAHILHDALTQQGITARIRNEHLAAADFPNMDHGVEVWVKTTELTAARALAAEMDAEPDDRVVACPGCGEENPAHFGYCWSCGLGLEGAATANAAAEGEAAGDEAAEAAEAESAEDEAAEASADEAAEDSPAEDSGAEESGPEDSGEARSEITEEV